MANMQIINFDKICILKKEPTSMDVHSDFTSTIPSSDFCWANILVNGYIYLITSNVCLIIYEGSKHGHLGRTERLLVN